MQIIFKEWAPDAPDLNNSGGLIQCDNVLPSSDCYIPHGSAFQIASSTLPAQPQGMFEAASHIYAGTSDRIYVSDSTYTMSARTSTLSPITTYEWDFCRFDEFVIAVRNNVTPQLHTIGSASNFTALATSGTAPTASSFVGVINRFLMVAASDALGNPYVQWSAIDDPRNWPTPNSSTAIATQSGQQYFQPQYGSIYKIVHGDQFGLVFQQNAITRVTYVGPPVVFQFDLIDTSHGLWWPTAAVKVGGKTHFRGVDGFYVTDGVSLVPTGAGKIDKTFAAQATGRVRATYDDLHKCVMWSYADSQTTRANNAVCLSLDWGKWSKLDFLNLSSGGSSSYITGITAFSDEATSTSHGPPKVGPFFYDTNFILNTFGNPVPAVCTFRSFEMEVNPGGFSHLSRVKPIINGTTAGAITNTVYYRDSQADSFAPDGSAQSVTARDGFTHWRRESRYHMIQTRISGTFTKAIGNEVDIFPTSMT